MKSIRKIVGLFTFIFCLALTSMHGQIGSADPCLTGTVQYDSVSITASAKLQSGVAGKKIFVCSISVVASGGANNVAFVEGTGTVCATGITTFKGLSGGTTAATGWNFAANGGIAWGNGGSSLGGASTILDDFCVLVTNATQVNISYKYVIV